MQPVRRRVLATAGHVNHGKSTLVQALTGSHPDRLPEERARGMSIDLGYAFWRLPDGSEVGIVDVPGHRDFIANMLAGVGWVDAVLLVVAVDEGIGAQTREHLALVHFLGIRNGVVALTKIDRVPDAEDVERRAAEVRTWLAGTPWAEVAIVPVSARTGEGLTALTEALARVLAQVPPRPDLGRPRLAIDRAFIVPGFGPVVTGTLLDGMLRVGQQVRILPEGPTARIRGLQSHHQPIQAVAPAARVAVNLSGISRHEVRRGQWLVLPNDDEPTVRIDAYLQVWGEAEAPLRHNVHVKLHVATARVMARVRVLGQKEIAPGQEGFVQLLLERPVVVRRGDRFVLRRPSPPGTWAGGQVLDPHPPLHKRWAAATSEHLRRLASPNLAHVLAAYLQQQGYATRDALLRWAHVPPDATANALATLVREGRALRWNTPQGPLFVSPFWWEHHRARAQHLLRAYHRDFPAQRGLPEAMLKARLHIPDFIWPHWLTQAQAEGWLYAAKGRLALTEHRPHLTPAQQRALQRIEEALNHAPPWPAAARLRDLVGPGLWRALLDAEMLTPLSATVVVPSTRLSAWVARLRQAFPQGGFRVAQARRVLGLSRRYTLALLTYLDAQGITRRQGDERFWQNEAASPKTPTDSNSRRRAS